MKRRIKEVILMLSLALSAAWLGICIFYMVKDHEAYSSTIEYRGHSYIYFYNHGTSAATHDPDCPCHKEDVKEP